MEVGIGKYVIDVELNRLGYVVGYDEELQCYDISFKDEPAAIYKMENGQLKVVDYDLNSNKIRK